MTYIAVHFEHGSFALALTPAQVARVFSDPKRVAQNLAHVAHEPKIRAQLDRIPADALRKELRAIGKFTPAQLADEDRNRWRVVMAAAAAIRADHEGEG